jgi:uncharacterized membrane protein
MLPFLIQFLGLFAIALWVGAGAAIVFLVVPVIFERTNSRQIAADLIGRIIRRLNEYAWVAGPIALGAALFELAAAPGASRTLTLKAALIGGMLALATYSRLVIAPQIQVASPQRPELGRLHALSGLLLIAQTLLGAFAIGLTVMIGH